MNKPSKSARRDAQFARSASRQAHAATNRWHCGQASREQMGRIAQIEADRQVDLRFERLIREDRKYHGMSAH